MCVGAPLLSGAESRARDRDAIERLHIPGIVLMENAGRGAGAAILKSHSTHLQRVVVLCGPGQNGGDGYVVARHLFCAGVVPTCILVGASEAIQGDALPNFRAVEALGIPVLHSEQPEQVGEALSCLEEATLIVDGLFGTGLSRPIEGDPRRLVECVNQCEVPVISLDMPSGVSADTGRELGVGIRATRTLTFGARKMGLLQYPGAELAGAIEVVPLGAPSPGSATGRLIDEAWMSARLQPRRLDSHKGVHGHVYVIGGGPTTTGAAILAAMGAMRAGAGLVTIAAPQGGVHELQSELVEVMSDVIPEGMEALDGFLENIGRRASSVVCGPGLGFSEGVRRLVPQLASQLEIPVVLDADALTIIAEDAGVEMLQSARGPRVLTPHPGEAARLLGISSSEVQADRYEASRALAERSGQTCILKGAGTIVRQGAEILVSDRGTPALAVAGTGDVLAGAIGGLLHRLSALEAAAAAVFLHARAGKLASRCDRGLLAREVASGLPNAMAEVFSAR